MPSLARAGRPRAGLVGVVRAALFSRAAHVPLAPRAFDGMLGTCTPCFGLWPAEPPAERELPPRQAARAVRAASGARRGAGTGL